MGEARALAGIYARLVGARIRSQLEYRLSVALQLVGVGILTATDFVAIAVIFANVSALGDWSLGEVALLYALATISFALTDLVIGHLDLFPQMIREGTFDQILVRPLPSLLQVVASDFALRRIGKVLQGLAVLVFALATLEIDWTIGRVLAIPLAIASGALIYGAVWVALATIAFWIVDAMELVNAFTYGGSFLSQYPIGIFARWLRGLVVFVVPLAFVAYFPALYVLGKDDALGLPRELQYASPLVAVATTVAAAAIWRNAVRHYRSAGG
ncbi:MAG: ABC-2 family transporter protein [Actinomycetota bacterium]|nr:ABC-2 family transporter protein [Actinomycetota bacterium]